MSNQNEKLISIRRLMLDDGYAMSFQTMARYRMEIVRAIDDMLQVELIGGKVAANADRTSSASLFDAEKLASKFCEHYHYESGSEDYDIAIFSFCAGFRMKQRREIDVK